MTEQVEIRCDLDRDRTAHWIQGSRKGIGGETVSQLSIDFAPRTLCRKTDPATSKEAAARVKEFAKGQCAEILVLLQKYGAMTPEMIASRMGVDKVAVRRRLPDLQKAGLSRPNGMTAPTVSGRSQRVWCAS